MKIRTIGSLLLLACVCSVGCVQKDLVRPSLDDDVLSLRYAMAWPERVTALAGQYEAGLARADEITLAMPEYSPKYADHKAHARAVLAASADAGTTAPLAQRFREHDVLVAYFERSRKDTTSRLAVAAKAALDKENCSCDVSARGALGYALKRSHEEELERVRREFNEAQRLVDQFQSDLGRNTADSLRTDADAVAWASWFVNVEAVELALALERRVDEANDVESILKRAIETEEAWIATEGRSRAELREAEKRLEKLREVRTQALEAAERARTLRGEAKARIRTARDAFDNALRTVLTSLDE